MGELLPESMVEGSERCSTALGDAEQANGDGIDGQADEQREAAGEVHRHRVAPGLVGVHTGEHDCGDGDEVHRMPGLARQSTAGSAGGWPE